MRILFGRISDCCATRPEGARIKSTIPFRSFFSWHFSFLKVSFDCVCRKNSANFASSLQWTVSERISNSRIDIKIYAKMIFTNSQPSGFAAIHNFFPVSFRAYKRKDDNEKEVKNGFLIIKLNVRLLVGYQLTAAVEIWTFHSVVFACEREKGKCEKRPVPADATVWEENEKSSVQTDPETPNQTVRYLTRSPKC